MKILVIGGTGVISTAVCKEIIHKEHDLYVLNRGNRNDKLPEEVTVLQSDINDIVNTKNVLEGHHFDSVIQFISFTVEDIKRDITLFKNIAKQYLFISSASAYMKPLPYLPVTEEMELGNPYWEYSENKKKCEEYLLQHPMDNCNVTIVRPSHTYDETMLISQFKSRRYPYTMIDRIMNDKQIIIPDEGMSLWTLTFNKDFAKGFVDLIGNKDTYGNYYHLTGDKVYTWERINEMICEELGKKPQIIHIPTDFILTYFPEFRGELYGDKKDNLLFDNSKVKQVAKHYTSETDYHQVLPEIIAYYTEDENHRKIDEEFDLLYEACIKDFVSCKNQTIN
jgi:nucleoside-diphosphate-sugar epimerase